MFLRQEQIGGQELRLEQVRGNYLVTFSHKERYRSTDLLDAEYEYLSVRQYERYQVPELRAEDMRNFFARSH